MEARFITSVDELRALRGEWDSLLASCETASPFLTWEWSYHWWSVFGREQEMRLLTLRRQGELVGIVPLMHHRKGWRGGCLRELRFADIGGMSAPYADAIFHRDYAQDCADRLFGCLAQGDDWDRLRLRGLSATSPHLPLLARAAAERGLQAEVRPAVWCRFIALPGTFEQYLAGLSGNRRWRLRRDRRRLTQEHDVRFGRCTSQCDLERRWPEFAELVRTRWQSKGEATLFTDALHVEFLSRLVRDLFAKGWVRLWHLSLDGRTAAMLLALTYRGDCYFWYHGFDATAADVSLGSALLGYCIEDAIVSDRMRTFDFLRVEQDYKRSLAKERRLTVDLTVYGRSWRGRTVRRLTTWRQIARRGLPHGEAVAPDAEALDAEPDGGDREPTTA